MKKILGLLLCLALVVSSTAQANLYRENTVEPENNYQQNNYDIADICLALKTIDTPTLFKLKVRLAKIRSNQVLQQTINQLQLCINEIIESKSVQQEVVQEIYEDKVVALTFDDGPSKYTYDIINSLNHYRAKWTFFVLGKNAQYHYDAIRLMTIGGHEVANHGWDHHTMTKISKQHYLDQLSRTDGVIIDAGGYNTTSMRPTYGQMTREQQDVTNKHIVYWDLDSRDRELRNAARIHDKIMNQVYNWSIILLHDIHKETAEAVPLLIESLQNEWYRLVTLHELLINRYWPNPPKIIR